MTGYGERVRRAWKLYEAGHGGHTVTVSALVALLAAAGHKASRAQVSRWANEQQEPTLADFVALGQVLGVRPEWLAFGAEPMLVAPDVPAAAPSRSRLVPDPRKQAPPAQKKRA